MSNEKVNYNTKWRYVHCCYKSNYKMDFSEWWQWHTQAAKHDAPLPLTSMPRSHFFAQSHAEYTQSSSTQLLHSKLSIWTKRVSSLEYSLPTLFFFSFFPFFFLSHPMLSIYTHMHKWAGTWDSRGIQTTTIAHRCQHMNQMKSNIFFVVGVYFCILSTAPLQPFFRRRKRVDFVYSSYRIFVFVFQSSSLYCSPCMPFAKLYSSMVHANLTRVYRKQYSQEVYTDVYSPVTYIYGSISICMQNLLAHWLTSCTSSK